MRIKKHQSGNEYIFAEGVWVRNFTKDSLTKVNLTHMFEQSDYHTILKNEEMNRNYPNIANERLQFNGMVIVSDGYDFENRHLFLNKLPKDVAIFATNNVLSKWKLLSSKTISERRTINAYVANNPYRECLNFLPIRGSQYYPACVASNRTCHEFLKKYSGDVYTYTPTPEVAFGVSRSESYFIDDYRNPICACVGLAHQFKVSKLMLLCCDYSFKEQRDFSVPLSNGLFTYPQHIKSQRIIDANLYWLKSQEFRKVEIANYSNGIDCDNAVYIKTEQEALNFFRGQEEGTQDVTTQASLGT